LGVDILGLLWALRVRKNAADVASLLLCVNLGAVSQLMGLQLSCGWCNLARSDQGITKAILDDARLPSLSWHFAEVRENKPPTSITR